jgi:hypothetical protein
MADFLLLMQWDILVLDQEEGIGTIDTFCAGLGAGANALAESTKFICIRGVPSCLVPGVTAELVVFKELARCWIQHQTVCRVVHLVQSLAEVSKASNLFGSHGE